MNDFAQRSGTAFALPRVALLVLATAAASSAVLPSEAEAQRRRPAVQAPADPIAAKVAGASRREGLLPVYVDAKRGTVWLEFPAPSAAGNLLDSFLYVESLRTGLGSNPVGLDRGQLGDARVIDVRRVGGKVLFEERNLRYRADTTNELERRAVRESFATSVLWAAPIEAEAPDGRLLVDFSSFLLRDAHDVVARLRATGQGSFSLDASRSAIAPEECLSFPDNLEFEALLTFTSQDPGSLVRATAPTGGAISLVAHHSLIRLPDDGYRPRRFDPRSGSFGIRFSDYAAPLSSPLDTRWLVRHRLEKTNPAAAVSPVHKPLVYYVDSGTPEPVRSALREGAAWWADAFEAAGFRDAFRVEILPEGAHPLDVRYNVIQWVHRSTRGWAYGGGIIDPRTGEMVKGQVTLDSLRVRQDRLLFEGLVGAQDTGSAGPNDPLSASLARLRQLSAHEVGHALGLIHNFAASTYGRASVMDYPAPLVRLGAEGLDLSDAYATGIGAWDRQAIRYAYLEAPDAATEESELAAILRENAERGLLFLADSDARPAGAAHPLANLWDNGAEPVAALRETMAVRRAALARFGEGNIPVGEPVARLNEVFVPLYLHHRYQVQAAAKVIGGLLYEYNVRGDGRPPAALVDPAWQRRALDELLAALAPEELDLPEDVLGLLLPRAYDDEPHPELFALRTAPAFDALGAAATAASLVVDELLQRERAARLVDFHRRNPSHPSFEEVSGALVTRVFAPDSGPGSGRRTEIQRSTQRVVVEGLLNLAADADASAAVRARAEAAVDSVLDLMRQPSNAAGERVHRADLVREIERHRDRERSEVKPRRAANVPPPGQPIGSLSDQDCAWHFRE